MTLTPRSRSLAIRATTRNCWKSFSPNIAKSGRHCVNSLPTTVVTPPKKCGRKRSSRPAMAGPLGQDPGGKAVRVHGFDVRIPDQVDFLGGQLGDIGLPGARVGTEILRRRELSGIDEDRNDDPGGAPLRQSNQRHMAVMECSHGWHQCDGSLPRAAGLRGRAATRASSGQSSGFATSGLDLRGRVAACSGLAAGIPTLSSPTRLRQADRARPAGFDEPRCANRCGGIARAIHD